MQQTLPQYNHPNPGDTWEFTPTWKRKVLRYENGAVIFESGLNVHTQSLDHFQRDLRVYYAMLKEAGTPEPMVVTTYQTRRVSVTGNDPARLFVNGPARND
jgi:hypothetical protein